jgi:hypothetical protein
MYFVEYQLDGYDTAKHYAKVFTSGNANWRELQQIFDPRYRYSHLVFYRIDGEAIKYKQGD